MIDAVYENIEYKCGCITIHDDGMFHHEVRTSILVKKYIELFSDQTDDMNIVLYIYAKVGRLIKNDLEKVRLHVKVCKFTVEKIYLLGYTSQLFLYNNLTATSNTMYREEPSIIELKGILKKQHTLETASKNYLEMVRI